MPMNLPSCVPFRGDAKLRDEERSDRRSVSILLTHPRGCGLSARAFRLWCGHPARASGFEISPVICDGSKRKDGARSLRGVGWKKKKTRLYAMRELAKDRLG